MATFLLKTEPDEYSYDDLVRDGRTVWDGVTNPAAQQHMRGITAGDEVYIYHTGDQRRLVGIARVVEGAYPDPKNPARLASGEPKYVVFDIAPVRALPTPVPLSLVKSDRRFADFALVRQARLSVMPVPPELDAALRELAGL